MTINDINLAQNTAERSFVYEFAENGLSLYTGLDQESNEVRASVFRLGEDPLSFHHCCQ